jgi:predicted HicB family RNase H-like nuclease
MSVMTYKGYTARIEHDDDDKIFFGKLAGIHDGVSFHADTVAELETVFRESVDDYIETCAKIRKEPQVPSQPLQHAETERLRVAWQIGLDSGTPT